jgi:hypothetical protein
MDIWSPLRPFGIFCGNIKKNLAALESPLTYQWQAYADSNRLGWIYRRKVLSGQSGRARMDLKENFSDFVILSIPRHM